MVRVAVIGAGTVGLSTAVNIQDLIPWAKITIIADKFDKDTTSTGAGGIYVPSFHMVKGLHSETLREWGKDTWDYFTSLAMSPLAKETGQTMVQGFFASDDKSVVNDPHLETSVFNYRVLTPEDLKKFNLPYKYGSSFMTFITQTKKFMPWLMRKFKEQGGQVEFRTVGNLDELVGFYDIVVNCSALGSKHLVPDRSIYPVKGQLVMLKAPWVKSFFYCSGKHSTYVIPHDDYLIVGGTKGEGDYSTDVVPEVQEDILQRAQKLFPQLKGAEVVGSWAGLRPTRVPVRLEKELLLVNGQKLRVVHNYGHGAYGIALSWGTALRAARMVKEWTSELPRSSRL